MQQQVAGGDRSSACTRTRTHCCATLPPARSRTHQHIARQLRRVNGMHLVAVKWHRHLLRRPPVWVRRPGGRRGRQTGSNSDRAHCSRATLCEHCMGHTHPAAKRLAPSTAAAATLLPSVGVDRLDTPTSLPRCWTARRAAAPAAAARHKGPSACWSPPGMSAVLQGCASLLDVIPQLRNAWQGTGRPRPPCYAMQCWACEPWPDRPAADTSSRRHTLRRPALWPSSSLAPSLPPPRRSIWLAIGHIAH